MTHFDVFNGDADGLCALHQLRLAAPLESDLVSGPKRDIGLLARVPAQRGDVVTVLDVSLAANRDALMAVLDRGASVRWFDHHYAGEIPRHPRLSAHIDPSAGVCTAMLVDRCLDGAHRIWAVVAAFGDNLRSACHRAGGPARADAGAARAASRAGRDAELQRLRRCRRRSHRPSGRALSHSRALRGSVLVHEQ